VVNKKLAVASTTASITGRATKAAPLFLFYHSCQRSQEHERTPGTAAVMRDIRQGPAGSLNPSCRFPRDKSILDNRRRDKSEV
jgi:hypothetical protein